MPDWKVTGYTPVRALGSGGFGEVMLARHDASGTLVAIKYLRPDLLADPGFARMFRGEAVVLASLTDPNVVRFYEYVESPAGAAIVMELIAGVSLREILILRGHTTAEAALVVLQGSLLGLAAAHRRGLVHRDYKPENVLVAGDGASKLTDFGLAARTGDRPLPAGTYLYAAPEQAAGGPASPAGDVYAATATFYECLTGRPPFTGESAEVLRRHRFEPVPLDPVPETLRPLVAAGMAKDPRGRPADASALVAELQTVASRAYGTDWHDRGRSHLGEAALLLAALWPAGAPPAAQATAVHRIALFRHPARAKLFRHLTPVKAAVIAGAVVVAAAAGAAVAASLSSGPHLRGHPAALEHQVTLQPTPTTLPIETTTPIGTPAVTVPSTGNGTSTGTRTSTGPGKTNTGKPCCAETGPPPPPPPHMVTVTIPASGGWVDTGIAVTAGTAVTISASGQWTPDGQNYAGPDGFGYSTESADNYFNVTDLGACGVCASTLSPNWGQLISYTGSSPPPPGSYTSTAAATQAEYIDSVGSSYRASWPYTGELWLGYNDDAYSANTSDNSGQVTATITVPAGAAQ